MARFLLFIEEGTATAQAAPPQPCGARTDAMYGVPTGKPSVGNLWIKEIRKDFYRI